jgi:small subunit ribosomal protein S4
MGDPRKLKNKFSRPKRLFYVSRILEEKSLKKEYGLKNMRELWVSLAELKKYRREARRLLSLSEEERKRDAEKILSKLIRLKILKEGADLDNVLSLTVRDILERRLQTVVYRKGMAATILQARQLITHGFITVNGIKVTAPSYYVDAEEEKAIAYSKPIQVMIKKKESSNNDKAEEAKVGEAS